jgi:hypothetical protein
MATPCPHGDKLPFRSLDYLYTPSADVAGDVRHAVDVLGGAVAFAIEAMGTRVAMVRLADSPPAIVLADHLEAGPPILVYRVDDLDATTSDLEARGWGGAVALDIPQGPVRSFRSPGGHRFAIYELTRPGVLESFLGRRDF